MLICYSSHENSPLLPGSGSAYLLSHLLSSHHLSTHTPVWLSYFPSQLYAGRFPKLCRLGWAWALVTTLFSSVQRSWQLCPALDLSRKGPQRPNGPSLLGPFQEKELDALLPIGWGWRWGECVLSWLRDQGCG